MALLSIISCTTAKRFSRAALKWVSLCQCRHCTHSPFALLSQIRKLQHILSKSLHTPQLLMSLVSYSLKCYLSWICRSLFFFLHKRCSRKVKELCSNRGAEYSKKILCLNAEPKAWFESANFKLAGRMSFRKNMVPRVRLWLCCCKTDCS